MSAQRRPASSHGSSGSYFARGGPRPSVKRSRNEGAGARRAELVDQALRERARGGRVVVEVRQVEVERAILGGPQDLSHEVREPRRAVRGEAHDLVDRKSVV